MNKYGRVVALLAAATVWAASVAAAGESSKLVSTFDDIHYWIGEGTNRIAVIFDLHDGSKPCLLYKSPSPRDEWLSRMPSSA